MEESQINKVAEKLLEVSRNNNITIATAESCTGGLVAAALTAIPGASSSFKGGIVSYTNEIKHNVLGVNNETLEKFDAVSEETAREMAIGAARVIDADIAVSVTGFAGPDGGIPGKPVGTVCFGYCIKDKTNEKRSITTGNTKTFPTTTTTTETCHFTGDRNQIREQAAFCALNGLCKRICQQA